MKKSLIFKILYLVLGLVVMAGASVFATNTYLASQVSYGSTTVENALNNLFIQSNIQNYSTDEQVVGKLPNGKPIYRKFFTANNLSIEPTLLTNRYSSGVNLSIPNIETIISSTGSIIFNDNTKDYFLLLGSTSMDPDKSVQRTSFLLNTSLNFQSEYSKDTLKGYNITIEYTKTTDDPTNN